MKSPIKKSIGEVVTDYGARVMKVFKKGLLGRSLFDFYGEVKADNLRTKESSTVPNTPVDGDGGVMYTKSSDGKLYYKSNEVSEVELSSQGTNTTYSVSCVDGDNSDEEKIRLTGSDSSTDDVVLEAGTGLSIARNSDKITFTNTVTDTNTTYSEATGSSEGLMSIAHHDKLDGIESNADVTDTTNVTAAGALMDSELTDLAGVKGVTISTLQVKPSEGAFANGDKTKLDGIAAGATADQTNVTGSSGSCTGNAATATALTSGDKTISGDLTVTSGTSGDATLIISADTDNNDENDSPRLWFKADGDITQGAIQHKDNTFDFISNVSANGGIRFLTGTTNNTGTTDPETGATEKMKIDPAGLVTITHTAADSGNGLLIVRSDTSTTTDDLLGAIGFDSTDGNVPSSTLEGSAYIAAYASEAHSTGDKGGYLTFGVSPINQNDDTVSTEALRVTELLTTVTGDLRVSGNQIEDDDGTTCITFDSSGNTSIGGTLSCADIDITGATNALTVNPQTGNVAINCISTDADCIVRVQDNSTAGTNVIGLVATGDDSIIRNDEGNFKVKMANNATTTLTLDQNGNLDITGNILPGITEVKILPRDFIPDDGGRPAMIDDTGSDRWLESHSTLKLYANVEIPLGFKATHVHIYGSATSAITVYEADVNSKTVTSKGTGNIGTNLNITDVTADATNYILIELAQASGEEVYGGIMTIAKV